MKRKSIDLVVSLAGLGLAIVLLIGGGILTWANGFIHDQVKENLAAQHIVFPAKDDPGVADDKYKNVRKYAGETLQTGDQAKVYANDYIQHHIKASTGGKTYSEISSEYMSYPKKNPEADLKTDTTYQELGQKRQTAFMGETLRGMLLNAYAFDTMATAAGIAAIVAFAGSAVLLVLSILGFAHARKADEA